MYEILSSIANYSTGAINADVSLYLGNEIIDVKTVELSPGQSSELVFEDVVYTDISYRILLDYEDDLLLDNEAFVVLPDPRGVDVAYASETDSYLLESAVRSVPDINVYTGVEISEADNIDVWIVEGNADYTIDEDANYLFFNSSTSTLSPVSVIGDITLDVTADPPVVPTVTQVESTHPVLRFVNISDLVLYSMQDVELKDWARVLVGTSEGPLIIEGLYHTQIVIYVACDLYDTSMPFKAAFPIMLSNAIRYLGVGGTRHDQLNTLVGETLNITTSAEASYVLLENRRDSARFEVNNGIANAGYIFDPGVYEFASYSEGGELLAVQQYAVNALHADESRLAVAETIGVESPEGDNTIQANKEYLTNKEYYLWLLVIAVVIVGLEWFAFHTKSL
jgi:hypothetical protein